MKPIFTALFFCLLLSAQSFAQKKIVILGSSTAAGNGASTFDSSWARRLYFEFNKNTSDGVDTTIINLAYPGFVTYQAMPTDFVLPANRVSWPQDTARNVTKALSLSPDIILISIPSNDVNLPDYVMTETMNNFRLMYQRITSRGVKAYITTSQPRNDISAAQKLQLRQLEDSIQNNFGNNSINFYDDLVTSDGTYSLRDDRRFDQIHPNDIGHRFLFERVRNRNIFSAAVNKPPVANAGADQTITLPTNYLTLNGTGTDPDGSIVSYSWAELTGPSNAGVNSLSNAQLILSSLIAGSYNFRLTVTDNNGATASDDVVVTVMPASSSGSSIHIEAENWASMNGVNKESTSDIGGGYNVGSQDAGDWVDYSINIPSAGNYTLNFRIATMISGAQFQLKKSDGTVLATVNVPSTGTYQTWQTISSQATLAAGQQTIRIYTVVSPGGWNLNWFEFGGSSAVNQAPVANAGPDQIITLPASSVSLNGTGTDSDGTIASYQWTEISGPSNANFSSPTSASTTASALVQGSYTFRLKVTDNSGASATDDVAVTVNPAATISTQHIEAENWANMNGVWKETTSDIGGGYDVGSQDLNDWVDYSVNVSGAGTYTMNFRIATMVAGAQFQVRKSDGTVLTTVNVPSTGSYQTWQTISSIVNLQAGQQTIRIYTIASPAGWNLNWLELIGNAAPPPPPPVSTIHIEAENWSQMNGVQTESTSDVGGGLNVGGQDLNDWEEYSVNIPSAGNYTASFRIATMFAGAQFQVRKSDGSVLATVNVPSTGTYQTWQTITSQLSLASGMQTLRIVTTASPAGWNLNWWELSGPNSSGARAASVVLGEICAPGLGELSIYPNPSKDHVRVRITNKRTGTVVIRVSDMQGNILKNYSIIKSSSDALDTDLSTTTLAKGSYMITVRMGNRIMEAKMIRL